MWKNIVEPDRAQLAIWRVRIACWIPKATNTHSGCVVLIAFTLHQWSHEGALILLYTYVASLINPKFKFHYAGSSKSVKLCVI